MKSSRPSLKSVLRATAVPVACLTLLQACASHVSSRDAAGFQSQLDVGDYAAAANTAIQSGQIAPDGKSQNIVWSLNAGAALFHADDPRRSIAVLDNTEKLMQSDDLDRLQSAVDYKFTTYDGVMVNSYKAIDYLNQGNAGDARVEFRRSEDRQRRAEEYFRRDAEASQRKLAQGKGTDLSALFQKAQQSDDYRGQVSALSRMAGRYAPFENPFATYLGGIFLLTDKDGTASDRADGLNKLERASGMLGGDATSIRSDIAWAKGVVSGRAQAPQTWVVFENGQSATFQELRLVLPMVTGHPMTLALPTMSPNAPAASHLMVQAAGARAATAPVGSFDAVMASEFQKRMPVILATAVVEVAAKNGLSVIAQNSQNVALGVLSDVVANVSVADTRSWTALPKEFQAVRIATPADGQVSLATAEGAALGTITVPTDGPSIVYVKIQQAGAKPSMHVLKL